MISYNIDGGDLVQRTTHEEAQRDRLVTLLRADRYDAAPETAGMLHRALGPVRRVTGGDPVTGPARARQEVRRVLDALGLEGLEVQQVASALPEDWRITLEIS